MDHANPVEVQKYLKGADYPAGKNKLLKHAEENGAPETVLESLMELPDDMEYRTPAELTKEIGRREPKII